MKTHSEVKATLCSFSAKKMIVPVVLMFHYDSLTRNGEDGILANGSAHLASLLKDYITWVVCSAPTHKNTFLH